MNFDLNIDNYTPKELADMYNLPSQYDRHLIEAKDSQLRETISSNFEISKETQAKTLQFLMKAKLILLNQHNREHLDLKSKLVNFYNSSYELKPTKLDEASPEHNVQLRPENPYLSSFPSEFFPGVINPLKKKTIKKNVNIDTRFRDAYFGSPSSNFNITLPMTFEHVLQMQLASIELPMTFYNVSKQYGNNFFLLTVSATTTVTDAAAAAAATTTVTAEETTSARVITLPDGNYTHDGIVDAINNQTRLAGFPFDKVVFMINIYNNSGSGQMMVGPLQEEVTDTTTTTTTTTTTVTSITIDFQTNRTGEEDRTTPLPLKLGWALGFRNGMYFNNLNYVSESIVDITGMRYVYLVVDDHNNNVNNGFYSAFNASLLNNNILARISLQSRGFDVQLSNNLHIVTSPREYFGPVNLNNFNVQLLDEYGRVVDLNYMDFSFCLTLVTAYDI